MSTLDVKRNLLLAKQELLRRKNLAINQYKPSEEDGHNQKSFHKSNKFIRIVKGGNRSGKSVSTAAEAAYFALGQHPFLDINDKPKKIWIISSEYRTINEGTWRHLRPDAKNQPSAGLGFLPKERITKVGPKVPQFDIPSYLEIRHSVNEEGEILKSRIDFISGQGNESARKKTQAAAVDLIVIDEEIEGTIFEELLARVMENEHGMIVISATLVRNEPWILSLIEKFEEGDDDIFVTTLDTTKNPHISKKTVEKVIKLYSKESYDLRIKGESNKRHGLIFKEFNENHIIKPIPFVNFKDSELYAIMDPGYRTFAGLFVALNPVEMTSTAFAEFYLHGASLGEVAHEYNVITSQFDKPFINLIDPAAKKNLETGEAGVLMQLAGHYGISCIPAPNSIDAGMNAAHQMLEDHPVHQFPRFRIFNTLRNFISEVRQYKIAPDTTGHKTHARKDEPLRRNDHLMSCFRYFALFVNPQLIHIESRKNNFKAIKLEDRIKERVEQLTKYRERVHDTYLGTEI